MDNFIYLPQEELMKRVYRPCSGDRIFIGDKKKRVKLGNRAKEINATVIEIRYMPRKWWEFWKWKRRIGYVVEVK